MKKESKVTKQVLGEDMAPIVTINPNPDTDMPPTDETAGDHGPQHKHVGVQPNVEWSGCKQ